MSFADDMSTAFGNSGFFSDLLVFEDVNAEMDAGRTKNDPEMFHDVGLSYNDTGICSTLKGWKLKPDVWKILGRMPLLP